VWDLHYPPPDALDRDYPISAIVGDTPLYPLGPSALPGTYTVKLTAGGKSYSQSLTLKMDPRVKTSAEDLEVQFDMEAKLADAMRRDFAALNEVKALRQKLKEAAQSGNADLQSKVAALDKKAEELEGKPGGYGAQYLSTPAGRGLARLNSALSSLLAVVDSADAAPTTQAVAMFSEVNAALDEQLKRWRDMQSADLPELNRQLKQAGVHEIEMK
jgi:hypothetical protein